MKVKSAMITFAAGLLLAAGPAHSQKDAGKQKEFGIAIGFTGLQIREQLVNDIRHQGNFVSLGFYHRTSKENSIREIHLDLVTNPLKSRYETEVSSVVSNLRLNYRYLVKVRESDNGMQFFAGPVVGLHWNLAYFGDWDESHVYWVSNYSAGLDGRGSFQPSGSKIAVDLDLNMPALSLVSRPPERFLYKELNPKAGWIFSRLHDDLKLTSVHQHLEINTSLNISYQLSDKFKPGVFWRFNYLQNDRPDSKAVRMAIHSLGAQLIF